MNFKLGDFVRFVDENLEGYITRIIDKDTIGVTDSNDFEIPVLASKVTLVYGDPASGTGQELTSPPQIKPDAPFVQEGVYLGIVADQHSSSLVHFHLVNESSFHLLASITTEKGEVFKAEFANTVAPQSSKKVYSAQLGDIQIWPKFRIEILFSTQLNVEPPPPVLFTKSIKGKDLSTAKEDIALLNQKGWLMRLDVPKSTLDLEKLKQSFFK